MIIEEVKNALIYPFDSEKLMRKRKAMKRLLLEQEIDWVDKKIAILGGSTVDDVRDMMELFLLNEGIRPTFYQSEYNKFFEDAVFGNPELDEFSPDVVYIHTTTKNILKWPDVTFDEEATEQLLKEQFSYFETVWTNITNKFSCIVIQNNFERPEYRLLGNSDIVDYRGKSYFIHRLNSMFYDYAAKNGNFFIHDIDYVSSAYGLDKWHDQQCWNFYKYAMALAAIPKFAYSLTRIIKSIYGKNKKVLSLDLDNTLWGGVVGDDGVSGLAIGHETPKAEAFCAFQNYIREVKDTGVLLAINSKNDLQNALDGLEHPDGQLKPDDFSCIKANWFTKDSNVRGIAESLNLGIDSIVHVDDNPVEREMITSQLPMVIAPNIGAPEDYIQILDRSGFFEVTKLTQDDLERNAMYKANAQRDEAQKNCDNYEEFLANLNMVATIRDFEEVYIQRIAQLTNKTNQFNLTTHRYSEAEIRGIYQDDNYFRLYGKLVDKYGDNGVVSVLFGHREEDVVQIDLFLMSCRVLKRNFEQAMMDRFVEICKEKGVREIIGHYYPTAKNGMVKGLFAELGFEKISEDADGNCDWRVLTDSYINQNKVIGSIIK